MPKTDGYKTREKILSVAEHLFAEKGFDAASIDKIATAAGVNKGLIYYHFKDKKDIVVSIFDGILQEIDQLLRIAETDSEDVTVVQSQRQKIEAELEYCRQRKRIIAVMLMEALKADGNADFLFKCAEMVIRHEEGGRDGTVLPENEKETHLRHLVREFFTGFVPIIAFVALREKWCDYFGCPHEKIVDYFLDEFTQSHLRDHDFQEEG